LRSFHVENEWLDLAYINYDKVIMHGNVQIEVRAGDYYMKQDMRVEQELTQEQKQLVEDLMFKHEREMRRLLKGFVNA
jgi:hypothetical protein